MRRLCLILLLLAAAAGMLFAAAGEIDVVHLKDGSVLRGTILERQTYPEEAVILKTADGLQVTIPMDKIARITKEQAGGGAGGAGGAAEPHPMGRYAFELNVLGFLQFGPFARFEFEMWRRVVRGPSRSRGLRGALALGAARVPHPGRRCGCFRAQVLSSRLRGQPDLRGGLHRGVAEHG